MLHVEYEINDIDFHIKRQHHVLDSKPTCSIQNILKVTSIMLRPIHCTAVVAIRWCRTQHLKCILVGTLTET